jgi:hypothetical protein
MLRGDIRLEPSNKLLEKNMIQNDDSEKELIESSVRYLEETVDLFKSASKPKMESWIANEFLSNLGVSFSEAELISSAKEPPDIIFREASFEIKRKYDREPDGEFKKLLKKARSAEKAGDLFGVYSPTDITYTEISRLIECEIEKPSEKYPSEVKQQIDLLFYIELFHSRPYVKTPLQSSIKIAESGFRSVSFVAGPLSGVLYVTKEAPEFLYSGGVRVVRRKSDP